MSGTRTVRPENTHPENVHPEAASPEMPPVPLTIEGYSVLHQMMRFRWAAWRSLRPALKKLKSLQEASAALGKMEQNAAGQSAMFSLIGHKGDLMLVHFRESFEDLNQAELQLAQLRLQRLSGADDVLSVRD